MIVDVTLSAALTVSDMDSFDRWTSSTDVLLAFTDAAVVAVVVVAAVMLDSNVVIVVLAIFCRYYVSMCSLVLVVHMDLHRFFL